MVNYIAPHEQHIGIISKLEYIMVISRNRVKVAYFWYVDDEWYYGNILLALPSNIYLFKFLTSS